MNQHGAILKQSSRGYSNNIWPSGFVGAMLEPLPVATSSNICSTFLGIRTSRNGEPDVNSAKAVTQIQRPPSTAQPHVEGQSSDNLFNTRSLHGHSLFSIKPAPQVRVNATQFLVYLNFSLCRNSWEMISSSIFFSCVFWNAISVSFQKLFDISFSTTLI